jgi:hypothetical protein
VTIKSTLLPQERDDPFHGLLLFADLFPYLPPRGTMSLWRHRTIADLDSAEAIAPERVSEAIRYRTFDRTLWM